MMHKSLFTVSLWFTAVGLLFHCSTPQRITGGNSSETVIGKISNTDGSPACSAVVAIYPVDYDPVADNSEHSGTDTTDDNGSYVLRVSESGLDYTITAKGISSGTRALITDVHMTGDTVVVSDAVLRNTGTVEVSIPENTCSDGGYVYIPGTELVAFIDSGSTRITLDSVPAGVIPRIVLSSETDATPVELRDSVIVEPGETVVVAHPKWDHTRRLYLNTTDEGASVPGDVYHFPVCIKLTGEIFDFSQAQAGGSDIRFTKEDGSFLPSEIETWNISEKSALLWVTVDTVFGNNNDQYIVMYWGNPEAENGSDGASVFDTSAGFQAVWHLAEEGNTTVYDATGNRFDGTPYHMSHTASARGVIGGSLNFDGTDDYIVAHGTADGKLDFPENGTYSLSLWASADSIDTLWHGIAGKGHHQYYLQYKCFWDTAASWEFVEFQLEGGWNFSEYWPEPAQVVKKWVYLTGVRDGERQYLYVNGELAADTIMLNPAENTRSTDADFVIGCHLQYELLPDIVPLPLTYFNGKIDEVRVMNTIPDDNWVKLCYMNQKEEDALVEFR